METTVVLLITSLASAVLGFATFMVRACLKSNCSYMKCLCFECKRQPSDDAADLDISPRPIQPIEFPSNNIKHNPVFNPPPKKEVEIV
jgi:hypothetical protein